MGNGDEATTRPTGDSCGAHKQLLLNTAPSVDLKQKARSDRHQLVLTVVTLAMTTALLARLTSPTRCWADPAWQQCMDAFSVCALL
jgi:hypothetical protein